MQGHKKLGKDSKQAVPRHSVFSRSSAHRCEKAIESRVRQEAKRAIQKAGEQ